VKKEEDGSVLVSIEAMSFLPVCVQYDLSEKAEAIQAVWVGKDVSSSY